MEILSDQLDYFEPRHYYNARSVLLIVLPTVMAGLIWPRSPMRPKERQALLLVFPAIILAYWFVFQFLRLPLAPAGYAELDLNNFYAWRTNTFICLGFGAVFSAGILLRLSGVRRRLYGGLFLVAFLVLMFSNIGRQLNLGDGGRFSF